MTSKKVKSERMLTNTHIKWLFFDLGSTLVDETKCIEYRIKETLKQSNAPTKEVFFACMEKMIASNRLPYKDAVKEFGLEQINWPKEFEQLYESVPEVLQALAGKYKMGIIANQSLGSEERMRNWGILDYFDVIVASAEAGVAKPDKRIFGLALEKSGAKPEECCMIGDRLDNDIIPAKEMGLHTIWVRQSWFGKGNIELASEKPDVIVDRLEDILEYL